MALSAQMRPAIFLDKDGTVLEDLPFNVDPSRMRLAPGAGEALRTLAGLRLPLLVVSNQSGVALGKFDVEALAAVGARLRTFFVECGADLLGFVWCPHAPAADGRPACACRKPNTGLLRSAAVRFGLDLRRSWMVGDILDDVEAGRRAGCRTILVDVGNETQWRPGRWRRPHHTVGDVAAAAALIASDPVRCV